MTCEKIQDQLNDYVDGALPEAAFQEVELHLAGCAECRGEERLLRSLLAQAAALPDEKLPARDLWPQIVVRLDGGGAARPLWTRATSWMGLAAAAVVTVALGTLLGPDDGRGPNPEPYQRPTHDVFLTGVPAFAEAEREYARATDELMKVIEARRGSLPPETQEALERNPQTIDEALQEIRAALEKEPSSPQLNHLLASTHRKKVDVLQRVVRLTRA